MMDVDPERASIGCSSMSISSLPVEVIIEALKLLSPRDVLHFGMTSRYCWQIATRPSIWRHLYSQTFDPLPSTLSPPMQDYCTLPMPGSAITQTQSSPKGKEKASTHESVTDSKDEWKSWAALVLARDNADRQLRFYNIRQSHQILLDRYVNTLAVLSSSIESRDGSRAASETVSTFSQDLFPNSAMGRHRFRSWIYPRDLSKQPRLEAIQSHITPLNSRKRRKVTKQILSERNGKDEDEPRDNSNVTATADTEHNRSEQDLLDQIGSNRAQQLAAELHCLHGPLYSTSTDIVESQFWLQLCDPKDPRAPPIKPKSALLRLLNEQPRTLPRPCIPTERVAAQMRVYDSGNFAPSNQWGPLQPWIITKAMLDPSANETAQTIEIPGINAHAAIALVEVNSLQGAAVAASMLDQLEEQGEAADVVVAEPSSSPAPPESDTASYHDAVPIAAVVNEDGDEDEEEEEDGDFVPPVDWETESDVDSDSSFAAQLELAMSEASHRRSVAANRKALERRKQGPHRLVKEIDWLLVEAITLCMHCNIEEAKSNRGWGLHVPTALFQTEQPSGSSSWTGQNAGENGLMTVLELQELHENNTMNLTIDMDGPLTRRRRRSLMDAGSEPIFDPLRLPTGWDKSHGPDPRKTPGANPRDWAGVEGVWIGTYAFQDFPVYCAYQTALTRGIDFGHLEADCVGDCLQLCLQLLPEGERLPEADEQICAGPPQFGAEGYELLPEDSADVLPTLRLKGHALQYAHGGIPMRRNTVYGMVRPVYGYVNSTADDGGEVAKREGDDVDREGFRRARKLVIKGFHWNLVHRYPSSNSWSLSGVQPGGLGSRLPIAGIWTDADRNAAQPSPCGPWLYYRIGERRWTDVEREIQETLSSQPRHSHHGH